MCEKKCIKKACSIEIGRFLIFGILTLLLLISTASATDTGWVVPSSNVGGSGVTNPQNAYAADTSYAGFVNGNYWNWYGYGLSSIPTGNLINGIEVNARGLRGSGCGNNPPCYMAVRLSYDSGTSWTSYINTTTWTISNTDHILGGPTNTWAHSWTRDEIVNSFRVQALWTTGSASGSLDYLPVRVYYTAGVASTYNISGYITNASTGLPLNSATVQTNTSLSTTTNAQGHYIFTGLSNGTYNITATQSNYNSNYTIKTVNGANITNANISLSPIPPVPTYLLSGHVTNQSNGAAISGATVTTNTTLTTSTDGTGYYAFTVSNGNYLITASKTGYNSNSITRTVNGAPVGNADISLTSAPAGTGGKILVSTNRYVVLDDPSTSGIAQTTNNFGIPSYSWSSSNDRWSGSQTLIKGYALVLNGNGAPVTNSPVVFTVRNWDSATATTSTPINTDANGIASYSLDLNGKNYYGNWYVDATAITVGKSGSTGFIYNWWGCTAGGCESHGSRSPGSDTPSKQNSPYTLGRESITGINQDDHNSATMVQNNNNCVGCHRSYGGTGGGNQFTGQPTKTADVHVTDTCATCHASASTHNNNQPIKSCTDCHSWANLSQENTMSSGTTPMSNYSGNVAAKGHNPANVIPCIICHGPMHNITKPDESLRLIKNNIVEDSHCLTCHTSFEKHNGGVGCTLCHSQDVHAIKVLSQGAGYVNKGSPNQGECTNCHQNATFLNTLKNAPKAGSYSGTAPQVQKPLNHSTDRNGTKWGTYWTSTKDACVYCHGDNKHIAARLGNAAVPVGSDPIGGAIGTGTVCSSCHDSNDNDYLATMALLAPKPVANQPGTNWNVTGTDHASYGTTDADCKTCHGGVLSASSDISEFVHNVNVGSSGGANCISCHDLSGTAPKHIDVAVLQNSVHKNLNGALTDVNKACYACHGTGSAPSGHPANYKSPKECTDCHTGSGNYSAPLVAEHNQNGTDVITSATCDTCHDNNGMFLPNAGTNGMTTAYGHYVKDITNRSTNPYQHLGPLNTSNCVVCHNGAYTNNASWGTPVNISTSSKRAHSETLTSQCDICHKDSNISSLALVDFHNASVKTASSTDCLGCHQSATGPGGIYASINTVTFGKHNNVNGTGGQNTLNNNDCTTCHYNFDYDVMNQPGFTTPTKVCADCHTSGLNGAPIISNHNQNGVNISTTAYCSSCHNNSVSQYAYSQNASVGHYGTKTNLISTADCTNCHKDPVNASVWGQATDPISSGTFPHSIANTPKEDCYACHNSASDFHNLSLQKPAISTVTCLDCHKTTATMAPKKIDATVLASGSHSNRACENCHANATDTNMNTYSLTSDPAKTCTVCHTGAGQFNAPLVSEHNQVGQQVITGANCTLCHSNSGMYLTNTGTNGSGTAITHYIKDVTNTGTTPYQHLGPLNTSNCVVCHNGAYTNNASWGTPVNISTSSRRVHSETLTSQCDNCHKDSNVSSLTLVDFHNASVQPASSTDCLSCHQSATGPGGIYAAINIASFSKHQDVNKTTGIGILDNDDCRTCHYDTSVMSAVETLTCDNCHTGAGQYQAPIINNHQANGVNITTAAYCSTCHNNSINRYAYSENASVGHYGTNTTLIKPTVNQSAVPRFGFATGSEASAYNKDCNNCHNPSNPAYGNATQIDNAHTSTAICNQCHLVNNANDLHNVSLRIPGNYTCRNCHTNAAIASQFKAPDVTGTGKEVLGSCASCHGGGDETFDSLVDHNTNRTYPTGKGGFTDTVYLNNQNSLTVTKGTIVTITSKVNDSTGTASKVGGAEYYINNDPGRSRGIPMNAIDGKYDASRGKWENVTATIDTSGLESGTYIINVRGMDIGKQWGQVKNATLTIQSFSYINGTITNASVPIPGVYVSTTGANYTTGSDGNYSLWVPEGNYVINASKQPEFYDYTISGVVVNPSDTTIRDINLLRKPNGTISGVVSNG